MAFANPLVITVNGSAKNLPKINQDNFGSEYYLREATQEFRVKIRHAWEAGVTGSGKIHRSNVDVTHTVFSVTPGVPDNVRQVYTVVRNGKNDAAADVGYLGVALGALMVQARYEDLVGWVN
nr:MAG: putative coat protein [Leviviridae sp.]